MALRPASLIHSMTLSTLSLAKPQACKNMLGNSRRAFFFAWFCSYPNFRINLLAQSCDTPNLSVNKYMLLLSTIMRFEVCHLVIQGVNPMTFVAPNLAWGEARGGSIPGQWGCDRRATKPQAKFGATLRAAVLFGPGGVARSLQIHGRDMRVARSLPGPKTPRRKRHRI